MYNPTYNTKPTPAATAQLRPVDDLICPNFLGHSGKTILCHQTDDLILLMQHSSFAKNNEQVTCYCERGNHKNCPFYGTSHFLVAQELI